MSLPELPPPPVTDALRAEAKRNPDKYVYVIEPAFEGKVDIPGWAVRGAFPVDSSGVLGDEFIANPKYCPTPQGLNLPRPENDLERAVQFAATGHLPEEELLAILVDSEVFVLAGEKEDRLSVKKLEDGSTALPVFTSEKTCSAAGSRGSRILVRQLVPVLEGCILDIDPGNPVGVQIPGDDIEQFLMRR